MNPCVKPTKWKIAVWCDDQRIMLLCGKCHFGEKLHTVNKYCNIQWFFISIEMPYLWYGMRNKPISFYRDPEFVTATTPIKWVMAMCDNVNKHHSSASSVNNDTERDICESVGFWYRCPCILDECQCELKITTDPCPLYGFTYVGHGVASKQISNQTNSHLDLTLTSTTGEILQDGCLI